MVLFMFFLKFFVYGFVYDFRIFCMFTFSFRVVWGLLKVCLVVVVCGSV